MTAPPIVLHARPTRRQLVRLRLRLFLRNPVLLLSSTGLLAGAPVLRLFWPGISDRPWPQAFNFYFVLLPVVALVFLAIWTFFGLNHPATRAYLRDGADYAFSEDGLATSAAMGESKARWEIFDEAVEFPESFVIRIGYMQHFLPKADFAAGDEERLRSLLRERLGRRARMMRNW